MPLMELKCGDDATLNTPLLSPVRSIKARQTTDKPVQHHCKTSRKCQEQAKKKRLSGLDAHKAPGD